MWLIEMNEFTIFVYIIYVCVLRIFMYVCVYISEKYVMFIY